MTSDAWLAILGHCLRINDFVKGEIVMGVPPGVYSRDYSQKILDAIRASDMRINGEPYRISGNVRIIPQGAGIFFRHVKDHPDDFRKNVTVIDIGHHTMDMVFFAEGKYVESATESQEIGMSLVLDSIINAFYGNTGSPSASRPPSTSSGTGRSPTSATPIRWTSRKRSMPT